MTIIARYAGRCSKCGGRIQPGEQIDWNKATRETSHVKCPEKAADEPKLYEIGGGSGNGCQGWAKGNIVRASKWQREQQGYPEWLYVVDARSQYYAYDGLSFGVGDESGYRYTAYCRAATEEEYAPYAEELRKAQQTRAAKQRAEELASMIRKTGEKPERSASNAQGERLMDTQNIYGGGDWWVIGADGIWYVMNHGADGDAWDWNNVITGGAGAIGWRIPYSQELADELRQLAKALS